jgi:hypothetical protein
VVMMMAPVAVVTCDVGEGMMANPDVTLIGHVAPRTDAVGDIICDDGRSPVGASVYVDPVSVFVEIVGADGG